MIDIDAEDAYISSVKKPKIYYPGTNDSRYIGLQSQKIGYLIPNIVPRFTIKNTDSIFTIGSCFARSIARCLRDVGIQTPALNFQAPDPEFIQAGTDPTTMLNEYNTGTTYQRIFSALNLLHYDDHTGVEETGTGYLDMFLPSNTSAVSHERLVERRRQIVATYQTVLKADVVIIALGLTEAWFDVTHQCYLNRGPSLTEVRRFPGRYRLRKLDYGDNLDLLEKTIIALTVAGVSKIILAVSPVSQKLTFLAQDAILSNCHSTSVLRAVVEKILDRHPNVDYLPAFEIATSFGMAGYIQDNRHLNPFVTQEIVKVLCENFMEKA